MQNLTGDCLLSIKDFLHFVFPPTHVDVLVRRAKYFVTAHDAKGRGMSLWAVSKSWILKNAFILPNHAVCVVLLKQIYLIIWDALPIVVKQHL